MTTASGMLRKKAICIANCMLYWIIRGTHLEVLALQAGENQTVSLLWQEMAVLFVNLRYRSMWRSA